MGKCECVTWCFPDGLTKGQHHHPDCEKYDGEMIPRLFYYEDAVDAWVPMLSDHLETLLDTLNDREELDITIKRVDMTDKQFASLEEV